MENTCPIISHLNTAPLQRVSGAGMELLHSPLGSRRDARCQPRWAGDGLVFSGFLLDAFMKV